MGATGTFKNWSLGGGTWGDSTELLGGGSKEPIEEKMMGMEVLAEGLDTSGEGTGLSNWWLLFTQTAAISSVLWPA